MGDSANNVEARIHRRRKTPGNDYKLHHHLGNASPPIDSESGAAQQRAWWFFRHACVHADNSGMDAAGVAAWGSWYTDHIVTPSAAQAGLSPPEETNRDCLRQQIQAMLNSE